MRRLAVEVDSVVTAATKTSATSLKAARRSAGALTQVMTTLRCLASVNSSLVGSRYEGPSDDRDDRSVQLISGLT